MTDIYQKYYYSQLSSNLPPHLGDNVSRNDIDQYTKYVTDEGQILKGNFCIPTGCYGVSFKFDNKTYSDETSSFIESALYIKKNYFYTKEDIVEKFSENSDVYFFMQEGNKDLVIQYNEKDYGIPVEFENIIIVEGNDYNYKVLGCFKNQSFGEQPTIDVEQLTQNWMTAKAYWETVFSLS